MEKTNSRQLARTWPFKRYKTYEKELQASASAWFSAKGYAIHTQMGYCLPKQTDWPMNIICTDVAEHIMDRYECQTGDNQFPLHKYLHHGLSSQAMIFNLVGPLIVRKDLGPLRQVIESTGIKWPTGVVSAEFEADDRDIFNEDTGQPTSIDLKVSGESGSLFIEAKLVEREFGGCSVFAGGDCDGRNPMVFGLDGCYLHHIGRKYWERLKEFGFDRSDLSSGAICPFTCYYQFYREALFALINGGSFILLYDERNPVFLRNADGRADFGLWPFLVDSVPDKHRGNMGRITIQRLVVAIEESGKHGDWISDFKNKYALG